MSDVQTPSMKNGEIGTCAALPATETPSGDTPDEIKAKKTFLPNCVCAGIRCLCVSDYVRSSPGSSNQPGSKIASAIYIITPADTACADSIITVVQKDQVF